jgi:hypothetical protein
MVLLQPIGMLMLIYHIAISPHVVRVWLSEEVIRLMVRQLCFSVLRRRMLQQVSFNMVILFNVMVALLFFQVQLDHLLSPIVTFVLIEWRLVFFGALKVFSIANLVISLVTAICPVRVAHDLIGDHQVVSLSPTVVLIQLRVVH